jgi:hypothetical protein
MKPRLGTSVTALFIATLTLRSTVIVAAVSYHHERTINSTEMPTQSIRAFNSPLLKCPFSVTAYPPFSFRHTNPRGDSKMRKTLFASMLAAGLVLPAFAEDAGTIKLHSGWKLIQERVDKGVAYGTLWAVTFNDAGSGPLHMAPASGTYSLTQETGKGEGELTWGEGDDQLKGSFRRLPMVRQPARTWSRGLENSPE